LVAELKGKCYVACRRDSDKWEIRKQLEIISTELSLHLRAFIKVFFLSFRDSSWSHSITQTLWHGLLNYHPSPEGSPQFLANVNFGNATQAASILSYVQIYETELEDVTDTKRNRGQWLTSSLHILTHPSGREYAVLQILQLVD